MAVHARYQRAGELVAELAPGITEDEVLKLAIETGAEVIDSCEVYSEYSDRIVRARELSPSEAYERIKPLVKTLGEVKTD